MTVEELIGRYNDSRTLVEDMVELAGKGGQTNPELNKKLDLLLFAVARILMRQQIAIERLEEIK